MLLVKQLVLGLCWAFLCISYSNSQTLEPGVVYTTPNITDNAAWVGGVYQQNLTCWSAGDPGYCGPQPIVNQGGSINFSYGSSYIYQQRNPATFLPSATGLQVTGFNFGFTAKNGNGWDDGRTDQLTALVRFWDTTGGRGLPNLLERREYDLNYKFNWTTFNYSETFTQPLSASTIGTVQYGFIGRDNNGWAGPYGPEIHSVNFNLRYSVDPCVANPLHAPTCSGYLAALAQLAPPAAPLTTTETAPVPPQTTTEQTVTQQQTPQPTTAAAPAPAAATTAPTPVAAERTTGGGNLSLALNLIARNAERERGFQQQAVASAVSEAQAAGDRALETASSTSTSSSVNSLVSETTNSAGTQTTQITQSTTATTQQQSLTAAVLTQQQSAASQQTSQQNLLQAPQIQNQQTSSNSGTSETVVATQQNLPQQLSTQQDQELPQQLIGFVSNSTNPLREIVFPTPQTSWSPEQTKPLSRVVEPNSAAGGVGLEGLMTTPTNYASYTQLVLRDAQGYPPREVYRGQTVVDNRQALRGLGSDRKHQDLVNLQYK